MTIVPLDEPVTLVKGIQHYFSSDPHGKKVEMVEFKTLTSSDKDHLENMLVEVGYKIVRPIAKQ